MRSGGDAGFRGVPRGDVGARHLPFEEEPKRDHEQGIAGDAGPRSATPGVARQDPEVQAYVDESDADLDEGSLALETGPGEGIGEEGVDAAKQRDDGQPAHGWNDCVVAVSENVRDARCGENEEGEDAEAVQDGFGDEAEGIGASCAQTLVGAILKNWG